MRRLLFLPFLLLLLHLLSHTSFAADFAFDYKVSYKVTPNGVTKVDNQITVTNLTSDFYAQNYTLTINSDRIDRVSAKDEEGSITPEINTNAGQTIINVPFNVRSAGLNKAFTFDLTYYSLDVATQKGNIWEIIIPGIDKTEDMRSYQVTLDVPDSFGPPAYLTPPPGKDSTWQLSELTNQGITAAFGDAQLFSFNLIYHLVNEEPKDVISEITLPPDTAFQKVVLSRLSETPLNVITDQDGNWLAQYKLKKGEVKKIIAEGSVTVYLTPRQEFRTELSVAQKAMYTKTDLPFWETDQTLIAASQHLTSPRQIYEYVIDTLEYDYQRLEPGLERLGAKAALAAPDRAVCMEFSDLFVSLARSKGIPTREIHGYAATNNSRLQPLSLKTDVLHAWVEYFDYAQGFWIPIDPTWGETTNGVDYFSKLDFNHVTFAILGAHSNYPYPAGSFRQDREGKDVFVEYATHKVEVTVPKITTTLTIPTHVLGGLRAKGDLTIKNNGAVAFTGTLKNQGTLEIDVTRHSAFTIPPYGQIVLPLTTQSHPVLTPERETVQLVVGDNTYESTVTILPIYMSREVIGGILLIIVLLIVVKRKHRRKHI